MTYAAACLGILVALGAVGEDKKPDRLAPLAPYVGEWVVDGKWAGSNEPLHARAIYEWTEHRQAIHARTYVTAGSKEYLRYDAMMGWHPRKKSLFQVSFAYNGELTENLIEPDTDGTLKIGFAPFDAANPSRVRQTLRLQDKDAFVWTAWLKEGDQWKPLIEATWRRKGS